MTGSSPLRGSSPITRVPNPGTSQSTYRIRWPSTSIIGWPRAPWALKSGRASFGNAASVPERRGTPKLIAINRGRPKRQRSLIWSDRHGRPTEVGCRRRCSATNCATVPTSRRAFPRRRMRLGIRWLSSDAHSDGAQLPGPMHSDQRRLRHRAKRHLHIHQQRERSPGGVRRIRRGSRPLCGGSARTRSQRPSRPNSALDDRVLRGRSHKTGRDSGVRGDYEAAFPHRDRHDVPRHSRSHPWLRGRCPGASRRDHRTIERIFDFIHRGICSCWLHLHRHSIHLGRGGRPARGREFWLDRRRLALRGGRATGRRGT